MEHVLNQPVPSPQPLPPFGNPGMLARRWRRFMQNGETKRITQERAKEIWLLRIWGLQNMLWSKNPLHERMTWFWHNHFTSSTTRVRYGLWMAQHDLTLRRHALGKFDNLLRDASLSAAMLAYLDGHRNVKGRPNENFARELLELFTLGEGHYTEKDIKEAARALTGWSIDLRHNRVIFRPDKHDHGLKTFLGRRGHFGAHDIFDILLQHPRTAEFICEKLWREFISIAPPDGDIIRKWALAYRNKGYDMRFLLRTIFRSEAFWADRHRGGLIKSPIDLVAGTLRALPLEETMLPGRHLIHLMAQMGQILYNPPTVAGWKGGREWIDDHRLMARRQFLQRISRGRGIMAGGSRRISMAASERKHSDLMVPLQTPAMPNPEELPRIRWAAWLLAIDPVELHVDHATPPNLQSILLDPAFQVK